MRSGTALFVLRRLAQLVPVVLAIAALNFALAKMAPGDAADILAGQMGHATLEFTEQLRREFGLDLPILEQFLAYMGRIVRLDLGVSLIQQQPVIELIADRLPATLLLMVTALVLAIATGVALGDIGLHLLFGVAVLAVGFFLFAANIIGGGDAKLLAAAAVWTGFPAFAPFALWTAIAGGVMALALLAARHFIKQADKRPVFVNRLLKPQGGVPYGVAIMAGGLMAMPALPFALGSLTLP